MYGLFRLKLAYVGFHVRLASHFLHVQLLLLGYMPPRWTS